MNHNTIRVADSEFQEPAINVDEFNRKYREWLRRRGFSDEIERMDDRANLLRKKNKKTG